MSQPTRPLIKRRGVAQRRTSVGAVEDSQSSDEEQHSPPVAQRGPVGLAAEQAGRAQVPWVRRVVPQQPPPPQQVTGDAALLVPESTGRGWPFQNALVGNLLARFSQDLLGTMREAIAARNRQDGAAAKVALRKAMRIAEAYVALTGTALNQWQAGNNRAQAAAVPYAQAILIRLNTAKASYRNLLHTEWAADYPVIPWQELTQSRISGQGATGVVFGYAGNAMRTVLKASAEDPLGALLLANLLHQRISGAGTVSTLDVSIDRDTISQSVLSQLQPDPPNRTAADVATMKASFADPATTIFAFGVAAGSDLKTLARSSKARLDDVMKNDASKAMLFWKKLGRIVAVDRFLGIDDRAAPVGSNVGNIVLGAAPDAITVIDNYDSNTQRDIAARPQYHNELLAELGPANVSTIAGQIVADVRYQVEWEAQGGQPAQPRASFQDQQLAGFLKDGIQEAIGLLVFKLVGSATSAADISAEVQRIRQADAESSRTGQPSPGLDWAAITGRAADLRQMAGQ